MDRVKKLLNELTVQLLKGDTFNLPVQRDRNQLPVPLERDPQLRIATGRGTRSRRGWTHDEE